MALMPSLGSKGEPSIHGRGEPVPHVGRDGGLHRELRKEHGEVALISKGSSLKLCMVAEGKADCYPRFAPTMEWDTARRPSHLHGRRI